MLALTLNTRWSPDRFAARENATPKSWGGGMRTNQVVRYVMNIGELTVLTLNPRCS